MSDMFPKSALLRPGYRPEQVDRYLGTTHEIYDVGEPDKMDSEGVRTVAFNVVPCGYQPQVTDVALNQLEAAFLQYRHAAFVAKNGRQVWMDQVIQLATTLYPRLLHPAGEYFAPTSGQGYDKTDVDVLMDCIAGYSSPNTTLTSGEMRRMVSRCARGNKAYGEPSIDRHLAHVVEVLLSIE